jgi:hypothetical protein
MWGAIAREGMLKNSFNSGNDAGTYQQNLLQKLFQVQRILTRRLTETGYYPSSILTIWIDMF